MPSTSRRATRAALAAVMFPAAAGLGLVVLPPAQAATNGAATATTTATPVATATPLAPTATAKPTAKPTATATATWTPTTAAATAPARTAWHLQVALSASPTSVAAGGSITTTVTVTNTSSQTVTGALVDATGTTPRNGPLGLTSSDCWATSGAGGHFTCRLPSLAPWKRAAVHLMTSTKGVASETSAQITVSVIGAGGRTISNSACTSVQVRAVAPKPSPTGSPSPTTKPSPSPTGKPSPSPTTKLSPTGSPTGSPTTGAPTSGSSPSSGHTGGAIHVTQVGHVVHTASVKHTRSVKRAVHTTSAKRAKHAKHTRTVKHAVHVRSVKQVRRVPRGGVATGGGSTSGVQDLPLLAGGLGAVASGGVLGGVAVRRRRA